MAKKIIKKYKAIIIIFILLALAINLPETFTSTLNSYKWSASSTSVGQQTHGLLSLYRYYYSLGDTQMAKKVESLLIPADAEVIKSEYSKDSIAKKINELTFKPVKTAQDYIMLAQLNVRLGKIDTAKDLVKIAHDTDPIRADVDKLFYQLNLN